MIDLLSEYELNFKQLFNMAMKIYKDNIKTFAFILFIIFFPISLVLGVINQFMVGSLMDINFEVLARNIQNIGIEAFPKDYVLYNILYIVVKYFFEPLGLMAVAFVVLNYVYGKNINYKAAVSKSFEKGGMFLIGAFLYIILIFLGSILIFPALYFGIACYFYPYSIIIDNSNPVTAIFNSMKTVRRKWFKTLFYLIVIYIIQYGISNAFTYIVSTIFGDNVFFASVVGNTAIAFINIVFYCTLSLLYINRMILIKKSEILK